MQYQKLMDEAQEKMRKSVVDAACSLFLSDGVEQVKMTDVAKRAQVGVASVYRYFGTKRELLIHCGVELWRRAGELLDGVYTSEYYLNKTGWEQAVELLKVVFVAYNGHPEFLRFLSEFDAFMISEGAKDAELVEYESGILGFNKIAYKAFEKGISDGTIRQDADFDAFYFTATHALLALASKLTSAGHILSSDERVAGEKQLGTLVDMAAEYIKKR